MPTVTRMEYQKHNQERVNVYLDDEFAFGLNVMDAVQLRRGQELSDAEIAQLLEKDAIAKAVERGVVFLSYRPRSRAEVRQHLLKKKDLSEDAADAALERLAAQGYLDDRAFVRFWVDNRNQFKPRGQRALRYELLQKGIESALLDEVLPELINEQSAAYQAAQARIRRYRGKPYAEFKQKMSAFLQRRGFNYGEINAVLQQITEEITEETPDFFMDWEDDA